ncbi:MAG: hypothetical protein AAF432_11235 [Planctomycetota bacterium]
MAPLGKDAGRSHAKTFGMVALVLAGIAIKVGFQYQFGGFAGKAQAQEQPVLVLDESPAERAARRERLLADLGIDPSRTQVAAPRAASAPVRDEEGTLSLRALMQQTATQRQQDFAETVAAYCARRDAIPFWGRSVDDTYAAREFELHRAWAKGVSGRDQALADYIGPILDDISKSHRRLVQASSGLPESMAGASEWSGWNQHEFQSRISSYRNYVISAAEFSAFMFAYDASVRDAMQSRGTTGHDRALLRQLVGADMRVVGEYWYAEMEFYSSIVTLYEFLDITRGSWRVVDTDVQFERAEHQSRYDTMTRVCRTKYRAKSNVTVPERG